MKKFSILCLLSLFTALTFTSCDTGAKNYSITGVVYSDGEVLSDVDVSIRGTQYKASSDENGVFKLELSKEDSKYDSYAFNASKEGYETFNKTLLKKDFVNGVCNLDITLYSTYVTLYGNVTDGNNVPLEGVRVSVQENSAQTDASGNYTFTITRPIEAFSVQFKKDYYETYSYNVTDFTKSNIEINAILNQEQFSVTGQIFCISEGGELSGANIDIKQSLNGEVLYSTYTDEDGSYSLKNLVNLKLPYYLIASHEKCETVTKKVESKNPTFNFELPTKKVAISGNLFPAYAQGSSGTLSRDSIYIYLNMTINKLLQYEPGKEESVSLYLNTGDGVNTLNGSKTIEFKMTSNEDIITVWDYSSGGPTVMTNGILWDDEIVYKTNKDVDNSKTHISLRIKFDVFAKFGANYSSFNCESTFGVSFSMWSDFNPSNPWTGWDVGDGMSAVNGSTFIDPANPLNYIRYNKEGFFYQSQSNEYVTPGTYVINGVVVDEENNPLEGASVEVISSTIFDKTDSEGVFSLTLENQYFALVPNLKITKDGYKAEQIQLSRTSFENFEINNVVVALKKDTVAFVETSAWGSENWTSKLYRNATEFIFECKTTSEFATPSSGENVCSIWLAFGNDTLNSTTRDGKQVLELKFLSTRAWCGVWSYKSNNFISWTPGVSFSWSADRSTITYKISVDYIRNVAGFSDVQISDTIGVTFSQWNANLTNPFSGWFISSTGYFLDPGNPTTYAKWDSLNNLIIG